MANNPAPHDEQKELAHWQKPLPSNLFHYLIESFNEEQLARTIKLTGEASKKFHKSQLKHLKNAET